MTTAEMLRDAAANIDWSARVLRLKLQGKDLPEGSTRELLEDRVHKLDMIIDDLFQEADTLEKWGED